jgi:hypothetical protein
MQKCVCSVKETGRFGSSLPVILSGALLHIVFIAGLSLAFNFLVAACYITLMASIFIIFVVRAIKKGHKANCAARTALLRVLDLGTFISPF